MSYKIECVVKSIIGNSEDSRTVAITPTDKFKITKKNPIEGGRPTEYALFVGYPFFGGTEEIVVAKLKRLIESETNLVVKLKADSFDFVGLAVAKTSKAKARILVDEKLEVIESVELI